MNISGLNLNSNVFLAPMAGTTDEVYRRICKKWGCGPVYSEMVSAKGLYYKDKKTENLLQRGEADEPYFVQIFGSEPDVFKSVAAKAAEYGDVLDINMGCPTPKIVNNGDGSALLKDIELLKRVASVTVESVKKPVTVKIRIGWDDEHINAVEVAKSLEDCGVGAIAVHGRTRQQFYSGCADWNIIKQVKQSVKIPVIANGDVFSAEDAVRILQHTGCDGVMIGRGAQGNPFIFKQINEIFEKGKVEFYPTAEDKINQAIEHVTMLVQEHGENIGVKEARKHIAWYIKGLQNSAVLKTEIFKMTNLEQITRKLEEFMCQYE